jgi:RHS repeat-associated protein
VINGTTTLDYTYDDADQMTDVEGTSYDYDDNGNRTDGGSDTYDWDHENRLAASSIDSVSASYEYNGAGLRTSRTLGATTVGFVWDQNASLPVVLRDTAGNHYVYGLDLLTRINGTDEEWYLTDGLGSTTALADAAGDLTGTYTYDVFGAVRSHTGDDTEWSYTGEQYDPTGLEYLRARYYEPETGRFISRDPIPFLQRYAYVANNPASMVDPTGLRERSFFRQVLDHTYDIISDSRCWTLGAEAAVAAGFGRIEVAAGIGVAIATNRCGNLIEWQRKMLLWAKRAARTQLLRLCPEISSGYVDHNFTAGAGMAGTIGVQCTREQGYHWYYGAGGGIGAAYSLTHASGGQSISEGTFCGGQLAIGRGRGGFGINAGLGALERLWDLDLPVPFLEWGGERGSSAGATGSLVCGVVN